MNNLRKRYPGDRHVHPLAAATIMVVRESKICDDCAGLSENEDVWNKL